MTNRPRRSKTRKVAAGVGGLGAVAALIAYLLGGFLGLPFGLGSDQDSDTKQPPDQQQVEPEPQPLSQADLKRPMVIEISGHQYFVQQQPVELGRLIELASAVPDGQGPAVVVRRLEDSRARAENDLKEALEAANVTNRWESPLVP
ncbi:MAG: hypothetical protein ACLFUJ_11805 [Phycisphaerae bacterium]